MDVKFGYPYPAGNLSNLTPYKFTFRGVKCNSMEGLLQSLKYENPEEQIRMCLLVGHNAKKAGYKKDWWTKNTLFWNAKAIPRDSEEYQLLLDEAFTNLFTQNEKATTTLLATEDAPLTHRIGKTKGTILTQNEFCSRLLYLRDALRASLIVDL